MSRSSAAAAAAAALAFRARREAERATYLDKPYRPIDGISLVIAQRGAGKTLFMQHLVEQGLAQGARFLLQDRFGHWSYLLGHPLVVDVIRTADTEACAKLAIKAAPVTLVVDELDRSPMRGAGMPGSALEEIVQMGRQAKGRAPGELYSRPGPVALLGAARRPKELSPSLRAGADLIYIGHLGEPLDLQWVADGPGLGPRYAAAAAKLPPRQFLPVRTM